MYKCCPNSLSGFIQAPLMYHIWRDNGVMKCTKQWVMPRALYRTWMEVFVLEFSALCRRFFIPFSGCFYLAQQEAKTEARVHPNRCCMPKQWWHIGGKSFIPSSNHAIQDPYVEKRRINPEIWRRHISLSRHGGSNLYQHSHLQPARICMTWKNNFKNKTRNTSQILNTCFYLLKK